MDADSKAESPKDEYLLPRENAGNAKSLLVGPERAKAQTAD